STVSWLDLNVRRELAFHEEGLQKPGAESESGNKKQQRTKSWSPVGSDGRLKLLENLVHPQFFGFGAGINLSSSVTKLHHNIPEDAAKTRSSIGYYARRIHEVLSDNVGRRTPHGGIDIEEANAIWTATSYPFVTYPLNTSKPPATDTRKRPFIVTFLESLGPHRIIQEWRGPQSVLVIECDKCAYLTTLKGQHGEGIWDFMIQTTPSWHIPAVSWSRSTKPQVTCRDLQCPFPWSLPAFSLHMVDGCLLTITIPRSRNSVDTNPALGFAVVGPSSPNEHHHLI
ncbi:hypothetical protein WG66_014644, partial [Moniliophthora roreri]